MTSFITPAPDDLPDAPDIATEELTADSAVLARLAALPPIEYDRCREAEAKQLGIRTSTLDAEVKRLRDEVGPQHADDAPFLDDPELWPEPVDGGVLLTDLTTAVKRHLVLPAGAAEAVALWIVHAHAHDTASISPILAVTSPTPECGKTTLLTLLGACVPRPLPASNITAAALFRAVEKWTPTVLVDEADTFLRDNDDLRGVLNSGHNRHAAWIIRTAGDDHDPCRFRTWSPKAIALIGRLPATLESRSIHVELRRIASGEHVEPLRGDRLGHLEPLRRKAWRWATDNAVRLADAEPGMPSDAPRPCRRQLASPAGHRRSCRRGLAAAGPRRHTDPQRRPRRAIGRHHAAWKTCGRCSPSMAQTGCPPPTSSRRWGRWKTAPGRNGRPTSRSRCGNWRGCWSRSALPPAPSGPPPAPPRVTSSTQFEEPFRRYLPDRSVTP